MIFAPEQIFFIVITFGHLLFPDIKSKMVDGVKFEFKHNAVSEVSFSLTNSVILFLIASSNIIITILRDDLP